MNNKILAVVVAFVAVLIVTEVRLESVPESRVVWVPVLDRDVRVHVLRPVLGYHDGEGVYQTIGLPWDSHGEKKLGSPRT